MDLYKNLGDDLVRDHCHVTAKFRGAAHNKCNLKLKISKTLPAIFHNLQGYDGHIIFNELNNFDVSIDVISKGIEKCMAIIVNKYITFIDMYQFMPRPLNVLATNMLDDDLKHLTNLFSVDKLNSLRGKDAYSYEWVDSYEKFNYEDLPRKECFYLSFKDGKN